MISFIIEFIIIIGCCSLLPSAVISRKDKLYIVGQWKVYFFTFTFYSIVRVKIYKIYDEKFRQVKIDSKFANIIESSRFL